MECHHTHPGTGSTGSQTPGNTNEHQLCFHILLLAVITISVMFFHRLLNGIDWILELAKIKCQSDL